LLRGVAAAELEFPATPADVGYDDVLSLPFRREDALYHYGEDVHQFTRLWLPPEIKSVSKLIVFIHGGCWLNEFDMSHTYPLATALSQTGYAVWSLEYRRTGDQGGGWPGSFDDIKAGINFLTSLADYDLNSTDLAIGGHLALLAGIEFPQARAVVGLAAISDIQRSSYKRHPTVFSR
jgi:acetyl esterase/lipase